MGKSSAPSAPDPKATAQSQQQINATNQYTPYGSLTYAQNGTWADGTPKMSSTVSLTPQQQQLFNGQQQQSLNLQQGQNSLISSIMGNYGASPAASGGKYGSAPTPSGDQSSGGGGKYGIPAVPNAGSSTPGQTPSPTGQSGGQQNTMGGTGNPSQFAPVSGGMNSNQFNNWTDSLKTTAGPASNSGFNSAGPANTAGFNSTGPASNAGFSGAGYQSAGPSASAVGAGAGAGAASAQQANSNLQIQQGLQGAGDLQGQFNNAQKAAYDNQMQYLQPQFDQKDTQLKDQLAQQGITAESNPQAYQHAMQMQSLDKQQQQTNAYNNSYQTGLASNNQLFNQSLNAGQFANSAQAQDFGQSATNAGMVNNVGMANAANQTQAGIASAQNMTQAGIASMQAQNSMNQFNAGQFNTQQQFNSGQQNALGQFNAGQNNSMAQYNAGQANQMGQYNAGQMNSMNQYNSGQANNMGQFNATQANNMGQFNANLNNQAQNNVMQAYGQNANLNNAANQQQWGNYYNAQNQPISQLNALRGMTQIQNPQFGATPQVDLAGLTQSQYQSQLASSNNSQQGLYGLGGSAMGMMGMMYSDIRLKHEIQQVGTRPDGLGVYNFRYIGDPAMHTGVMAHEVENVHPHAVFTMPSGFKAVNYAAI